MSSSETEEQDDAEVGHDSGEDPYAAFERQSAARRARQRGGDDDGGIDDDEEEVVPAQQRRDWWEEEEEEEDDDFAPSPRRPKPRSAQRQGSRQPAFTRKDKGWIPVQRRINGEQALEQVVRNHGNSVAPGRGFTHGGPWRPTTALRVRNYRCNFKGCPATLRAEMDQSKFIDLYASNARDFKHKNHKEVGVDGITVPAEIRALLTDEILALQPKKIRAALRKKKLPDGTEVRSRACPTHCESACYIGNVHVPN